MRDAFKLQELRDRAAAEKGRNLYSLTHSDLSKAEFYEARGRVAALSSVLHYMDNAEDVDEELGEEIDGGLAELGYAHQEIAEALAEGDDEPPQTMGVQ